MRAEAWPDGDVHLRHSSAPVEGFERWRDSTRNESSTAVQAFVDQRCQEHLTVSPDAAVLGDVLRGYVSKGKYIRSTFVLAGWLSVPPQARTECTWATAVRVAASMELLHCFALLQDDVMDGSPLRRGVPAAHVEFARWHRQVGLSGSANRFGESAAVLAGDLCLVWAEQMFRESGASWSALGRVLPRYDRLRSELAVGQFRDLVNESRRQPSLWDVRDVARAKSGNYTVRGPIELGADLAGATPALLDHLGRYGAAVGEAFQVRDDLLGLFGAPEVTGKPVGADLRERKATCVVVLAREHAGGSVRRELARLDALPHLSSEDVARYLEIIVETGARTHAERLIEEQLGEGIAALEEAELSTEARERLVYLARLAVDRAQ